MMSAKTSTLQAPTLAEKRKQWLEILKGDNPHSILNQLVVMAYEAAYFYVINQARGLAPKNPDGTLQLNGPMHYLLDRGFYTRQMVAIRRLNDASGLEGERGTWSLVSLLDDMEKNSCLFTRGAILEAEGLKYDYEHGPDNQIVFRHPHIDELVGVQSSDRRREDQIPPKRFDEWKETLKSSCNDIVEHGHKFVAHAASPESIADAGIEKRGVCIEQVLKAHQALYRVADDLSVKVLGDAGIFSLPMPPLAQFKYIDLPFVNSQDIPQLQKWWDDWHNRYKR